MEKKTKTEIALLTKKIGDKERLISTFENNLDCVKGTWNDDYNNFMKQYNNFNLSFDEKLLNQLKEEIKNLKDELYSKISEKYVGKSFYVKYESEYESESGDSFALYTFDGFRIGEYGEFYLTGTVIRYGKKNGICVSVNHGERVDVLCVEDYCKLIPVDINKKTINDIVYKIDGIGSNMNCFINGLMGKSEEGAVHVLSKEERIEF